MNFFYATTIMNALGTEEQTDFTIQYVTLTDTLEINCADGNLAIPNASSIIYLELRFYTINVGGDDFSVRLEYILIGSAFNIITRNDNVFDTYRWMIPITDQEIFYAVK